MSDKRSAKKDSECVDTILHWSACVAGGMIDEGSLGGCNNEIGIKH